jgi:hypothetical protein
VRKQLPSAKREVWASRVLLVIFCLLSSFFAVVQPAQAAYVRIGPITNSVGIVDTNVLFAVPSSTVANADGSFTSIGPPIRIRPTADGTVTNWLQANNYVITNAYLGVNGIAFRVPQDNGPTVHSMWSNRISGFNYFVTITYGTNPPPTYDEITNSLGLLPTTLLESTNAAATNMRSAIPTNYWSSSATLWLSNIISSGRSLWGLLATNDLPGLTNGFIKLGNYLPGNNITFTTNSGVVTIAASDTNGVSVAAGSRVSITTNSSLLTITAHAQTNGYTSIVNSNAATFLTTNYLSMTNGHVTASVTNGLATTNYVNTATNGFVQASITNGFITITEVTNKNYTTLFNFVPGANISFETNSGRLTIISSGGGATNGGNTVAAGTRITTTTNGSLVTVTALSQTNNFTTLVYTNPSTLIPTNYLPLLTNAFVSSAVTNSVANTNESRAVTFSNTKNSYGGGTFTAITNSGVSKLQGDVFVTGDLSADGGTFAGTVAFLEGISGSAQQFTNANASTLFGSGAIPIAFISGLTSNQFHFNTWAIATNLNGGRATLATNVLNGAAFGGYNITNIPISAITNAPTTNSFATTNDIRPLGFQEVYVTNALWLRNGILMRSTDAALAPLVDNSELVMYFTLSNRLIMGINNHQFQILLNSNQVVFTPYTGSLIFNGLAEQARHSTNADLATIAVSATNLLGGSSVTVSNYNVQSNPTIATGTNSIGIYGAGTVTANGTYIWNADQNAYTNHATGIIITFQNPTWYIQYPGSGINSTNYYSTSNAFTGNWTILNGAANAPTSAYGYDFNLTGARIIGSINSTNFDTRLNSISNAIINTALTNSFATEVTNIVIALTESVTNVLWHNVGDPTNSSAYARAFTNVTTIWVDPGGDDTNAIIGRRDRPYRTPMAASAAQTFGCSIIFNPGLYVMTNTAVIVPTNGFVIAYGAVFSNWVSSPLTPAFKMTDNSTLLGGTVIQARGHEAVFQLTAGNGSTSASNWMIRDVVCTNGNTDVFLFSGTNTWGTIWNCYARSRWDCLAYNNVRKIEVFNTVFEAIGTNTYTGNEHMANSVACGAWLQNTYAEFHGCIFKASSTNSYNIYGTGAAALGAWTNFFKFVGCTFTNFGQVTGFTNIGHDAYVTNDITFIGCDIAQSNLPPAPYYHFPGLLSDLETYGTNWSGDWGAPTKGDVYTKIQTVVGTNSILLDFKDVAAFGPGLSAFPTNVMTTNRFDRSPAFSGANGSDTNWIDLVGWVPTDLDTNQAVTMDVWLAKVTGTGNAEVSLIASQSIHNGTVAAGFNNASDVAFSLPVTNNATTTQASSTFPYKHSFTLTGWNTNMASLGGQPMAIRIARDGQNDASARNFYFMKAELKYSRNK